MLQQEHDAEQAEEPPVDGRVEGAIEDLNAAADTLNIVEDTKSAAERAAQRGAALVREELAELDSSHATLVRWMEPFLVAREVAIAAAKEAKAAEAEYARADEEYCKKTGERPSSSPLGKGIISGLASLRIGLVGSNSSGPKDPQTVAARQLVAEHRKAAQRASKVAEQRAVRLGELGEGLTRAGFADVAAAERLYYDYVKRRRGFEDVLLASNARLAQLEEAKEHAQRRHADAMESLEALATELAANGDGDGGGGGSCQAGSSDPAGGAQATHEGGVEDEGSSLRDSASWRPSRALSDGDDSFAGGEFSEDEDDEGEEDEEGENDEADELAVTAAAAAAGTGRAPAPAAGGPAEPVTVVSGGQVQVELL